MAPVALRDACERDLGVKAIRRVVEEYARRGERAVTRVVKGADRHELPPVGVVARWLLRSDGAGVVAKPVGLRALPAPVVPAEAVGHVDRRIPVDGVACHAELGRHLVEAEDGIITPAEVAAADAVPEEAAVEAVRLLEEGAVARVLVDCPRADHVRDHLVAVQSRDPRLAKVVRQRVAVGRRSHKGHREVPRKHVAIGVVVVLVGGGPRAHHDLEDAVKAVHAEKIVHGRLGVRVALHRVVVSRGEVHEVDGPQVVVYLDDVAVRGAKVGDHFVEQVVHPRGLCGQVARRGANHLLCVAQRCRVRIVHRPRDGRALGVERQVERVAAHDARPREADHLGHVRDHREVLHRPRRRQHRA
mmetsp:Transcript_28649/g.75770  ORF Transcript_28649/g.75770 Transcript_28649/m.75770 type:complete len:359 (+) Transcript_28649:790-1866(+)